MMLFNDTATTEIYTLALRDALPIFPPAWRPSIPGGRARETIAGWNEHVLKAGTIARRCPPRGFTLRGVPPLRDPLYAAIGSAHVPTPDTPISRIATSA